MAPTTGKKKSNFAPRNTRSTSNFGRSLPREKAMSSGTVSGVRVERRAAHPASGISIALDRSRLVRRGECEVAVSDPRPGRTVLGKYQARWYRTVRGEMIDGEMQWKETGVTHMQLKSFIARVTKDGTRYKVLGVVLNDGTPLKSVEVKIDEGPWQAGDAGTRHKGKVLLEAVHLYLERCDSRRTYAGFPRNGYDRQSTADRRGSGEQEIISRRQLSTAPETRHFVVTECPPL